MGQANVVDIKKIYEDMQRAIEAEIPRLPEGAFKAIFLPMFVSKEKNEHGVVMANWVAYADSPFKSVHIVDDNDRTKILFTVPPICDRSVLGDLGTEDKEGRPLMTLRHVFETYAMLASSSPIVGENYLNAELMKRFDLMRTSPDFQKNLQAWQEIFARYGYGEILETKAIAAEKAEQGTVHEEIEEL